MLPIQQTQDWVSPSVSLKWGAGHGSRWHNLPGIRGNVLGKGNKKTICLKFWHLLTVKLDFWVTGAPQRLEQMLFIMDVWVNPDKPAEWESHQRTAYVLGRFGLYVKVILWYWRHYFIIQVYAGCTFICHMQSSIEEISYSWQYYADKIGKHRTRKPKKQERKWCFCHPWGEALNIMLALAHKLCTFDMKQPRLAFGPRYFFSLFYLIYRSKKRQCNKPSRLTSRKRKCEHFPSIMHQVYCCGESPGCTAEFLTERRLNSFKRAHIAHLSSYSNFSRKSVQHRDCAAIFSWRPSGSKWRLEGYLLAVS